MILRRIAFASLDTGSLSRPSGVTRGRVLSSSSSPKCHHLNNKKTCIITTSINNNNNNKLLPRLLTTKSKHSGSRQVTTSTSNSSLDHAVYARTGAATRSRANYADEQTSTSTNKVVTNQCVDYRPEHIYTPYVDSRLSYAYGRSNKNFVYATVGQLLSESTHAAPDAIKIVSSEEGARVTQLDFATDVAGCVQGMRALGVGVNTPVGVFAYNCYHWLVVQTAANCCGATVVSINPSYKAHELAYVLGKAQVKLLFMPSPRSGQAEINNHWDILKQCTRLESDEKHEPIVLETVVFMDDACRVDGQHRQLEILTFNNHNKKQQVSTYSWSEVRQAHPSLGALVDDANVTPDSLFGIYFTSGTTGKPKGAMINQFTAINAANLTRQRIYGPQYERQLTLCVPLPLFHVFAGILGAVNLYTQPQTCVVMPRIRYSARSILQSAIDEQCLALLCTPTILIDILALLEREPSLRHQVPFDIVIPGGAQLSPEVAGKAFKLMPRLRDIRIGYGATETGSIATLQAHHEHMSTRFNSVGTPIDLSEVRIVSTGTDNGAHQRLVPHNTPGEIQTRGFNTMVGYIGQADRSLTDEAILASKWYRTGDLGTMDENGVVSIVGRIKELIIKGGENIYPKEIEDLLLKHEAIEDAHVVGVPDARYVEEVAAWIKLKQGAHNSRSFELSADQVIDYCKQHITYFKVPKYVVFTEEFPMTPTKKCQKNLLRQWTIERFKL